MIHGHCDQRSKIDAEVADTPLRLKMYASISLTLGNMGKGQLATVQKDSKRL